MGDTTDAKEIENSKDDVDNNQEKTIHDGDKLVNDGKLNEIKEQTPRSPSTIFPLNETKSDYSTELYSFRGVSTKSKLQQQQQKQQQQDNESILTNVSTSSGMSRNPLTGTGVSSHDEYTSKPMKRRDGNPVLGSGYIDDNDDNKKQTRIPPGGYSNGLW